MDKPLSARRHFNVVFLFWVDKNSSSLPRCSPLNETNFLISAITLSTEGSSYLLITSAGYLKGKGQTLNCRALATYVQMESVSIKMMVVF